MCELGRVIVKKVTQSLDDLSDGSGEIDIMFRQFFRERDKGIKRPSLSSHEKETRGW